MVKRRNNKIFFFIRDFPNYDHVAPVIYLLSKNKKMELNLVYTKVNYDYSLDKYHNLFSKFEGINIIDHTKYYKKDKTLIFNFVSLLEILNSYLKISKIKNLIFKIKQVMVLACEKEIFFVCTKQIKNERISAVFDYAASDSIQKIKKLIYKNGGQCFNLPHTVFIWQNKLRCLDQLSFSKIDPFNLGVFDKRDINIVENNKTREILKSSGVKDNKIKFLGSSRFSKKWVLNKRIILSEKKFIFSGKIKVLILCPKRWDNIFWDEFIRTIDLFVKNKSFATVLKPHPSTKEDYKFDFPASIRNSKFAPKHYTTSELIDWSDIVVNVQDSVFFEALIKRKIFVNLKHLHINQYFFSSMDAYFETKNRDDVVNFINNLVKKGNIIKYKQKNIDNLLFKTVYKKTSNPHEEVVNYLENFSL